MNATKGDWFPLAWRPWRRRALLSIVAALGSVGCLAEAEPKAIVHEDETPINRLSLRRYMGRYNRTTPTALTRAVLDETKDDDLYTLCVDYMIDNLQEVGSSGWDTALKDYPPGLLMAWHISGIDFEVPNGGFYQFFSNSTGAYAQETLAALRVLGLNQRADVLQDAIAFYAREYGRPADFKERWYGDESTLWKWKDEEALNRRYWKADDEEGFDGFVPYLRSHPELFVHEP
ncbi:MAG: DUF4375 domain-containing protein [Planctomycetaceae bacterium]|nr:DUF4375 domain-containing protein [Planctomycetaceae bacterium]